MDTNNPVVKLFTDGMKAEMEGKPEEARQLFMRAWEESKDDYDACIALPFRPPESPSPRRADIAWTAGLPPAPGVKHDNFAYNPPVLVGQRRPEHAAKI
jgi:hypothetical protein